MNTTNLHIKTLSPVHIGSGDVLKSDYEYLVFPQEKKAALIDPKKVLDKIGEAYINQWVEAIDHQKNLLTALPALKNCNAADLADRVMTFQTQPKGDIKAQIHLGNQQPTLPGSSLKGAIRTALLTKFIKDDPEFVQKTENLGSKKGSFMNFHADQISAKYFGDNGTNRYGELQGNPNKDLLRFLRVGDVYFDKKTTVVKNTVINLFQHGWGEKTAEGSYYECIPKGATATGTLQIPNETIKQVQEKGYLNTPNFDLLQPKRLFKIINQHTLSLIEREIEFWDERDNPVAIGDYLEFLENIKKQATACGENACVLRVGANSGWEFMTGGWASGTDNFGDFILGDKDWQDLKKEIWRKLKKSYAETMTFPKTRKMIAGGEPMGFVLLSF